MDYATDPTFYGNQKQPLIQQINSFVFFKKGRGPVGKDEVRSFLTKITYYSECQEVGQDCLPFRSLVGLYLCLLSAFCQRKQGKTETN